MQPAEKEKFYVLNFVFPMPLDSQLQYHELELQDLDLEECWKDCCPVLMARTSGLSVLGLVPG